MCDQESPKYPLLPERIHRVTQFELVVPLTIHREGVKYELERAGFHVVEGIRVGMKGVYRNAAR